MPAGPTIRLKYDIYLWLSSIDENLGVALNIVKAGYISHKDISKQITNEIDSAKGDIKGEIRALKEY